MNEGGCCWRWGDVNWRTIFCIFLVNSKFIQGKQKGTYSFMMNYFVALVDACLISSNIWRCRMGLVKKEQEMLLLMSTRWLNTCLSPRKQIITNHELKAVTRTVLNWHFHTCSQLLPLNWITLVWLEWFVSFMHENMNTVHHTTNLEWIVNSHYLYL